MNAIRAKNGGGDAYFTNSLYAENCIQKVLALLGQDDFSDIVEPSAGSGSFFNILPSYFTKRNIIGYDLEPKADNIVRSDFFNVTLKKDALVIGNPPFGFAASLAVKFFNHAANYAKGIAFIVPRTFQKKSTHSKLNKKFHLVHEEVCPENIFMIPGNLAYNVPCVFQIWLKKEEDRKTDKIHADNKFFDFTTFENADFFIRRVGGRAGEIVEREAYTESTTFACKAKLEVAIAAVRQCLPKFRIIRDQTAGVRSISKSEINAVLSSL